MANDIEVYVQEEEAVVSLDATNTIKGETGGYYKPSVSDDGDLSWTASRSDMPAVGSTNIKGAKGDKGDTGGYYKPSVSDDGDLTWEATRDDMPAADGANIKGGKGDKGDTGATPVITFEAETGAAGSDVILEQSGTAENPVIKLTIPRGDTGSVDGIDYYEGNPAPLGTASPGTANGLARGNHVHPMPSASDVGAAAKDHTHTTDDIDGLSDALAQAGKVKTVNNIEPDANGNIDLGELGGGDVQTVNGVAPDEAGNVQIGVLTSDPNEDSGETPEMSGVPINADQLGGVAASEYALKTDTAPDSEKLNGKTASEFLSVDGTAKDSEKLNGQSSGAYAFFAGDVFDNTSGNPIPLNGFLTSDAKNINVVIPFFKPIVADNFTFKTFQAEMRGISGYLNSASGYQNILSLYTVTPRLHDGCATVTIVKDSAFTNVANNTPVVLAARMRIEFS